MPNYFRFAYILRIALGFCSLILCSCGVQPGSSGNFAGMSGASSPSVKSVALAPASVVAGASTEVTVSLADPAPEGGVDVQLISSNTTAVSLPSSVMIAAGETSATIASSTASASSTSTVSISALYQGSVAGTSLSITPATAVAPSALFTISLSPSSDGIVQGHDGSVTVTTTVSSGYKHALTLSASHLPAGVSETFSPSTIPSPGNGSSKSVIAVQSGVKVGTYQVYVKASDGTNSQTATLTLVVRDPQSPNAKFRGCWYHSNGNRYQGVDFSVGNPGKYAFNATLYYGTTCNPNNWADEFGYGTVLDFGGFGYTYWFADFKNQADTSAIWQVGPDKSVCVNYETAPDC